MAEKFRIRIQEKISTDCVPNIKGKTITHGCCTFYILNLCTPRLLEGLILHCFKLEIYTRKNDIAAERSLLPSSSHLDRGADAPATNTFPRATAASKATCLSCAENS